MTVTGVIANVGLLTRWPSTDRKPGERSGLMVADGIDGIMTQCKLREQPVTI